jgi:hypothetical protein
VTEGWVYGLPELKKEQRTLIKNSKRITVPGCHATGFIAMLYPLVAMGIVSPDYPVTCHTTAGYSGGGKAMIADYQGENVPDYIKNPRPYSLALNHRFGACARFYPDRRQCLQRRNYFHSAGSARVAKEAHRLGDTGCAGGVLCRRAVH